MQAYLLKSITTPGGSTSRITHITPEVLILPTVITDFISFILNLTGAKINKKMNSARILPP